MKPWGGPMSAAEFRVWQCDRWSEKEFQDRVIELAQVNGWLAYHTHDARRSQPGFPDLVLVHARSKRILFWELKSAKGRVSVAQSAWLVALKACGLVAVVMRPSDWASGLIESELVVGRA